MLDTFAVQSGSLVIRRRMGILLYVGVGRQILQYIFHYAHSTIVSRPTDRPTKWKSDGIIDERVNEEMKQLLLSTKRNDSAASPQTMSSGWNNNSNNNNAVEQQTKRYTVFAIRIGLAAASGAIMWCTINSSLTKCTTQKIFSSIMKWTNK